jgi:hypothetical protein
MLTVVDVLIQELIGLGFANIMQVGATEESKGTERVVAANFADIEEVKGTYSILVLDDSVQLKESDCFYLLRKFKCDKLILSGDSKQISIGEEYFKKKAECSLYSRIHGCGECKANLHEQFRVSLDVIVVSSRDRRIRE